MPDTAISKLFYHTTLKKGTIKDTNDSLIVCNIKIFCKQIVTYIPLQKAMLTANMERGLSTVTVILPRRIEVRVLQLLVEDYVGAPCMKLELFGCRKTSCIGKLT